MKLENLILYNFKQYFGTQRIDFAKEKIKMVTIINGVNGAGKTSLFLALNWCLYGEGVDNIGELISKEAIKNAEPGEEVKTYVNLTFSHEGERYLLTRTRVGRRLLDEESIQIESPDEFTMNRIRWDGQTEQVKNPIGTMNAILPSNIRSYFLFDGEKIDEFAKPEAAKEVKEAIYLVFKLEILERAKRHFNNMAVDYRRELKSITSGRLRHLLEEDEKARGLLIKAENKLREMQEEKDAAGKQIDDIQQKLRGIQEVEILQLRRDYVDANLRDARIELDSVQNQIRDISTTSYTVVAEPIFNKALTFLDEKRARGEIPSSIRQQFVKDLIEQMYCICGRPFTTNSPEHKKLLSLIENTLPSSLEDDVLSLSADIRHFFELNKRQRTSLDQLMNKKVELIERINGFVAENDDLGRQLKDFPLEQVKGLEQQRKKHSDAIENYTIGIVQLNHEISSLKTKTTALERDIAQERKNEAKEKLLSKKLDLAQQSADKIEEKYHIYADETRQKIEEKTKEIFKSLVWKESHFQDIRISQDFNLEVIDRYQKPARSEMSAGERQILSLSFITAMSRISEEEAPLVMDTPFGRLSSTPRYNVTKFLPDLADQIVLFVTDEELREQARTNLEPRIGNEYRLEFNSRESITRIVEV